MTSYTLRLLTTADVADAMRLSLAAGWNQTEADWRRVLSLEPEGCFGIFVDGSLAASATAVCYGQELAWIGMVLTLPEYRERGFARQMMNRCLVFLQERGVSWIGLDATDMGKPLYASLGFRDAYKVERWMKAPGTSTQPTTIQAGLSNIWHLDADLDRKAFGADRARLLCELSRIECTVRPGSGFAMGRPGQSGAYFGPCVSVDPQSARAFLSWFLVRHGQEFMYWDLIPDNAPAVALALEFGFEQRRILTRMFLRGPAAGHSHDEATDEIYALAGFEFG